MILPSEFEMKSLEIYIYIYIFFFFPTCSKVKGIPEFGENKQCVLKLLLDDTAITKLPISIAHFTCLSSLSLRDCEHLMSLSKIFFYKYEVTLKFSIFWNAKTTREHCNGLKSR